MSENADLICDKLFYPPELFWYSLKGLQGDISHVKDTMNMYYIIYIEVAV